jgi:hypothetical protein
MSIPFFSVQAVHDFELIIEVLQTPANEEILKSKQVDTLIMHFSDAPY